jgi:hypothetical protein
MEKIREPKQKFDNTGTLEKNSINILNFLTNKLEEETQEYNAALTGILSILKEKNVSNTEDLGKAIENGNKIYDSFIQEYEKELDLYIRAELNGVEVSKELLNTYNRLVGAQKEAVLVDILKAIVTNKIEKSNQKKASKGNEKKTTNTMK